MRLHFFLRSGSYPRRAAAFFSPATPSADHRTFPLTRIAVLVGRAYWLQRWPQKGEILVANGRWAQAYRHPADCPHRINKKGGNWQGWSKKSLQKKPQCTALRIAKQFSKESCISSLVRVIFAEIVFNLYLLSDFSEKRMVLYKWCEHLVSTPGAGQSFINTHISHYGVQAAHYRIYY